ncbi:hypothetical protein Baya_14641 [Bagarius yarrelli]|uniref:C-type lectin domain-containing protein n=1 Tax=Bagarius yarrelli TaxID=175774 RepID=A0A556V9C4_BAGYA|nr:hypothetical protein Baya_14641 [Bagarius yarrelli]
MKMKAVLSVLLLVVLTGAAHGQIQRKYIFVNSELDWTGAQAYCRENYVDLATIMSEDLLQFQTNIRWQCDRYGCWIGLRWNETKQKFIWSDGHVLSSQNSQIKPNSCVYAKNDWYYEDCDRTRNFICYIWDSFPLVAVQEMKTWEEALIYCRMNYVDLASLVTVSDHAVVDITSKQIQTSSFWTGLRFLDASWFWVNPTATHPTADPATATHLANLFNMSDLSSMPSCPAPRFRCGARSSTRDNLEARDCEEKLNFMCYNGTR